MMTTTPQPAPSLFIRIGNFFFHYRNGLFPVLFLFLAVAVPPVQFCGRPKLDLAMVVVGALVAVLGQAIRCATIGLVYIQRGGKNRRIYAKDLVTEGIYAHTRNPMYLGNLLIAAGFCLVHGSPWVLAVVFPFFLLVYLSITRAEEYFLRNQFGAGYDEYCRTTNRFWPRMRGLGQTLSSHRFEWTFVVKKEYGTLFSLSMGLYVLILWKYYRVCAPTLDIGRLWPLAIPAVILLLLYATARWFKKTRRI